MSEDTEYTTVSVRVTEERREKWEEYIPECDAENMSQLVRMAVKHEIDGRADAPQTPENVIEPDAIGEVTEGITELQQAVSDVQTRLSSIEEEIEVTDAMDIQDAVFRALPTPPEGKDVPGRDDLQRTGNQLEFGEWAVTADDIAMTVARSTDAVREVLESLEKTGQVRSVAGGPENEKYYWKRE